MSEEERVQFKLMLPADLKAHLEENARINRRSLSAEIIERLEASRDHDGYLARTKETAPQIYEPAFLEKLEAENKKLEMIFEKYLGVFAAMDRDQANGLLQLLSRVRVNPDIKNFLDLPKEEVDELAQKATVGIMLPKKKKGRDKDPK